MTIKHIIILPIKPGCVVDGMSIVFHISKFGTKCNDKHMPMCFFLLLYRHSLLANINNTYSFTL